VAERVAVWVEGPVTVVVVDAVDRPVPVRVPVGVTEGDPVVVRVPVGRVVPVRDELQELLRLTVGVTDRVGGAVWVAETDGVWQGLGEMDAVTVGEAERLVDPDLVLVWVPDPVGVSEAVKDGLEVIAAVGVRVPDGVPLAERLPVAVRLPVPGPVAVPVPTSVAVKDAEAVEEAVRLLVTVRVPDLLADTVEGPVRVRVGDPVLVPDGVKEGDPVEVVVAVAVAVRVVVEDPVPVCV